MRDACRLLDVNEATLRQWADNGHLRVYRTPGGHRRFLSEDVMSLTNTARTDADRAPESEVEGSALRLIRRRLQGESVIRQHLNCSPTIKVLPARPNDLHESSY